MTSSDREWKPRVKWDENAERSRVWRGRPQHVICFKRYFQSFAQGGLWDFFLVFGTINQTSQDSVAIHNFQGIFLSPQQAKALANVLNQNVNQYEATFGEIRLEPKQAGVIQ